MWFARFHSCEPITTAPRSTTRKITTQVIDGNFGRYNVLFATRMATTSNTMPTTHSTMAPMRKGSAFPLRSACISSRTACVAAAPEPPCFGFATVSPVFASTK